MAAVPARENARGRVLEAAQHLVAREGVKALTIENVAREATMSRGGVLYHFPSKEALIAGMVAYFFAGFERHLDDAAALDDAPGAWARAFVAASFGGTGDAEFDTAFVPLVAAIAYEPRLLDPLRERLEVWKAKIAEGLDPTAATVLRLAAHAAWLNGLFHFNDMGDDERYRVREHLLAMTRMDYR